MSILSVTRKAGRVAHHRTAHPVDVPGCFGCKCLGLQISPAAMPSHTEGTSYQWQKDFDHRNDVDRAAYKRMRMNGLQPPRIDGCSTLEAGATTEYEVTTGQVFEGRDKELMKAAVREVEDAIGNPLIPNATPMAAES